MKLVLSAVVFCCSTSVFAEPADADNDQQAIQQTQAAIRNRAEAEKVLQASPQGKQVADQINTVMGSNSQDLYKTSADIFPELYKMADGDPAKMQKILQQAQRDPAGFLRSLSPASQKRISDLAAESQMNAPVPTQKSP